VDEYDEDGEEAMTEDGWMRNASEHKAGIVQAVHNQSKLLEPIMNVFQQASSDKMPDHSPKAPLPAEHVNSFSNAPFQTSLDNVQRKSPPGPRLRRSHLKGNDGDFLACAFSIIFLFRGSQKYVMFW
jgi:hypothetical protein